MQRISIALLAASAVLFLAPACTPRGEKPAGPGAGTPPAAPAETGGGEAAAAGERRAPAAAPAPEPAAGEAKDPPQEEKPKRPLANAKASEWDLCEEVLRALKARDRQALQALRITESEYKQYLFPEFPATRAGTDKNVDFHWDYLNVRSFRGIQNALDEFGGLDLELLDIITETVDKYPTYNLLMKVRLKVRRKPDGQEGEIRVFGSIVELDGQYKLLGFPT
jgi:hypothetical protein